MAEINLLARYPKSKRNIHDRAISKELNREIAKKFGYEYFDGPREQGYGGYRYDGRWLKVAEDIIDNYKLKPGDFVLDVGCAKGFLIKDLLKVCPGLNVYGLDISPYAVLNGDLHIKDRLKVGDVRALPYGDKSFDLVLSINTIHNLNRDDCIQALQEISRVSRKFCYVQVDAYHSKEEKVLFEQWMLTAQTYGTPKDWIGIFKKAGYLGDYFWTVFE